MTAPISSPHLRKARSTQKIMMLVALATVPGLLAQTIYFGWGNLVNVIWCCSAAMAFDGLFTKCRERPPWRSISDGSALVTGLLLGLSLPPLLPWWVSLIAVFGALAFGKHLYGGLGNNPFNPAMVGYALVLISFPLPMTTLWVSPADPTTPDLADAFAAIFMGSAQIDAYTGATPLDTYKQSIDGALASEVLTSPVFEGLVAKGWDWVNLAFAAGGIALLWLRIIRWHIPVAFLAGLGLMSLVFGHDADQAVPLSLHLLAGGTMLGSFFIATDPVSAATSDRGRLIYGAGIGILVFTIRHWGGYPDAIAFAVLLMNMAVPLIDHYTPPRTYGHGSRDHEKPQARPVDNDQQAASDQKEPGLER